MLTCKICYATDDVHLENEFVHCSSCGAEYQHTELTEGYVQEFEVTYAVTQSQTIILTQEEQVLQESQKKQAVRDAKALEKEKIFTRALRDLAQIPELLGCLPADFEEQAMRLFHKIDVKTLAKVPPTPGGTRRTSNQSDSDTEGTELDDDGDSESEAATAVAGTKLISWDVIPFMWMVLRQKMKSPVSVLMSDLIRWTRELHIFNPQSRNKTFLKTDYSRITMFKNTGTLDVDSLVTVDVKMIIRRTCIDLELPLIIGRWIWAFYRKKYGDPVPEPVNSTSRTNYELAIATSVIAVMKLHFGLNGQCEKKLDILAKEMNKKMEKRADWIQLFQFREWLEYLMWRNAVMKAIYYPSQFHHGMSQVRNDLSPLVHYEKERRLKLAEFQGARAEESYSSSHKNFTPEFTFSPSVFPYTKKDEEFRSRYSSLTEAEKNRIGIPSLLPPPDFKHKSVRHAFEPNGFIAEMGKEGVRIQKCPGLTGKVNIVKSLRPEKHDFQRYQNLRKRGFYYFVNPGNILCEVANIPDEDVQTPADEDVYELPIASQPLCLFEVSVKNRRKALDEWTRDLRINIPQSLAVVVETLADMFELTEVEILCQVHKFESAYNPGEVIGIQ